MLLLLASGGDEAEPGEADEALALHLLHAENERARQGTRHLVASCSGGLGRSSGEGLEAAGKEPRREAVLGGGADVEEEVRRGRLRGARRRREELQRSGWRRQAGEGNGCRRRRWRREAEKVRRRGRARGLCSSLSL